MYKLVIQDDEGSRQTVPVVRDEITIGRKEGNTIRLTERNVSRQHARVIRERDKLFIEAVRARYGIKKNGARIDKRVLFAPGDVISIGDYLLTVEAKSANRPGPPSGRDLAEENTRVTHRLDSPGPPKTPSAAESTEIISTRPAKLVVVSSNFAGQEFPLPSRQMVIGRGDDCDIIIDHRSVSNRHAKVVREANGKYQIVDLNSKNGITVDGEEYRSTYLKRGDMVELGHVKFRFVEPGENYVFTPPSSPQDDLDFQPSSSSKTGLIAGALVALLVAAAVGWFALSGPHDADQPADEVAVTIPSEAQEEPQPGSATNPKPADGVKPNKAAEALDRARAEIEQGRLDRAIGRLDSAKQYLEPSAEQTNQIDKLLATARNEQPFARAYQAAKSTLDSKNYLAALEHLQEIPSHSIFHAIMRSEGLANEALTGLLDQAEAAAKANRDARARSLVEEALVFSSENERARSLLASLEPKANVPTKVASNSTARAQRPTIPKRTEPETKPARQPAPRKPKVSRAEAKALYKSAAKKLITPDKNGAIRDCKRALKGGYTDCYRVLGVAYKQIGQTDQACRYFAKYLGTNPSNAGTIERQMQKMGCD